MTYTAEYLENLDAVMADETFVDELKQLTTADELVKAFANKQIELAPSDASEIASRVSYFRETGELDLETLECVNGGLLKGLLASIGAGAIAGACYGGLYGAVGGAVIGGTAHIVGSITYKIVR